MAVSPRRGVYEIIRVIGSSNPSARERRGILPKRRLKRCFKKRLKGCYDVPGNALVVVRVNYACEHQTAASPLSHAHARVSCAEIDFR